MFGVRDRCGLYVLWQMVLEQRLIRKTKRPSGASGLWSAYVIDEDADGTWLFSPTGSRFRAEQDGRVLGECEVGQGHLEAGFAVLHLVPARGEWWFAHIYGAHDPRLFLWPTDVSITQPGRRAVSIDICRPPAIVGRTWSYVDLEIDLLSDGAGTVITADEDEFADAIAAKVITAPEATAATVATDDVRGRLEALTEPFRNVAWDKFADALALDLDPIELPGIERSRS